MIPSKIRVHVPAYKSDLDLIEIPLVVKSCELVLARLKVEHKPDLFFGSFYRHTNTDPSSIKALQKNLSELFQGTSMPNLVLAGDFNLPDIDWADAYVKPAPQYGKEANQSTIDMVHEFSLKQVVEEPTRGRNILDLMFVSSPDLVERVEVKPGISDHDDVIADLSFQPAVGVKKPRKVYVYGKADKEKLTEGITHIKTKFLSECKNRNVNSNWLSVTDSLRDVMDKCIPKK